MNLPNQLEQVKDELESQSGKQKQYGGVIKDLHRQAQPNESKSRQGVKGDIRKRESDVQGRKKGRDRDGFDRQNN